MAPGLSWRPGGRIAFPGLLCALFVAALAWRSPMLLLEPRFWAEEGRFYYDALQQPGVNPWTLVIRGNFQLITNLAAAAAAMVPARWAAHVTTAAALLVALVNVVLLSCVARDRGWSHGTAAVLVAGIALLPHGYELYLTSTNLQWLCSVSMLLLCAGTPQRWPALARAAALAWTAACALSGAPPVMLAPVALGIAVLQRSRFHLAVAALLGAGALVQLAVIASHTHEGREFSPDLYVMVVATLLQAVIVPLTGIGVGGRLADALKAGSPGLLLATIALAVLFIWWVGRRVARSRDGASLAWALLAAGVVSACLNVLGAIGSPGHFVSATVGARYFYLAAIAWLLALAALANRREDPWRWVGWAAIALCVLAGVRDIGRHHWNGFLRAGPPWQSAVDACEGRRPCTVKIWPDMWTLDLRLP